MSACHENRAFFARGLSIVAALMLAAPSVAAAQSVYRWVGPAGVTNYGSKPPKDARGVRRLSPDGHISVIPTPFDWTSSGPSATTPSAKPERPPGE